jgi:hypothetical protein
MIFLRSLTLGIIGLFLFAGPVWAAPISDELQVKFFGAVQEDHTFNESPEGPFPVSTQAHGLVVAFPVGTTPVGSTQTLALLDPGTNRVSDLLSATTSFVVFDSTQNSFIFFVQFTFQSDCVRGSLGFCIQEDNQVDPFAGQTFDFTTVETGSLQDVTSLFTNLNNSGQTVLVMSDVEPKTVPEPSTIFLLGYGLASLGAVAWTRHRRK